jgi:hypothetical protein
VKMEYALADLNPTVTIYVPVPWKADESSDQRRSRALRCARQLIEHACRASGFGPSEPTFEDNSIGISSEATTSRASEGIAQEPGFPDPADQPKRQRAKNAGV